MKKLTYASFIILAMTLLTSCGSKNKGLISKKWTLHSVYGTEKLDEFIGEASIDLTDDESFSANWIMADEDYNFYTSEESGTWILNEEGIPEEEGVADLILTFDKGNGEIMTVQHLTESQLILVYAGVELTYK